MEYNQADSVRNEQQFPCPEFVYPVLLFLLGYRREDQGEAPWMNPVSALLNIDMNGGYSSSSKVTGIVPSQEQKKTVLVRFVPLVVSGDNLAGSLYNRRFFLTAAALSGE